MPFGGGEQEGVFPLLSRLFTTSLEGEEDDDNNASCMRNV